MEIDFIVKYLSHLEFSRHATIHNASRRDSIRHLRFCVKNVLTIIDDLIPRTCSYGLLMALTLCFEYYFFISLEKIILEDCPKNYSQKQQVNGVCFFYLFTTS